MEIDEMDFTPLFFGIENGTDKLNVSQNECAFFRCAHPHTVAVSVGTPAYDYFHKLGVYINRFNNPMPIPIRKELLRSIAK